MTLPFAPTALVGWLAGQLTDVPSSTVEALVESLHHDMVCAEQDFQADLLPAAYELVGVDDAIRRALARSSGSGPHDPLGPVPGDPEWAGGEIHYGRGAGQGAAQPGRLVAAGAAADRGTAGDRPGPGLGGGP